ncbi:MULTISPECIES: GmrSD restriction endonuclease domain-containing protein [Staphylococcus]|jgi:hypothetical protein|uniref:DUF262 domain-containing protein n=24 Tax=Staphylococcus TaxID=1279 RepID=D2J9F5_STAAU|nr:MULTISPECIES: DUF262 domain-containing protein [Staphylococcus]EHS18343.1 PF03235 family protein [Staphylococcus aureus subsp. aureus IS-55]ABX30737.1 hypothetical protein HMPREF0776_pUSA300HOUMS0011 [Staphylococcus aureus subsp. aureus USA300_TCH959]ACZ68454.1 hypothetical protein SAP055A_006 [Staphylococcus aureus]ACZ69023.1 hypothetical protein SAP056A_010 [Staphylococcus aureus]AKK59836.1 hypothetical protein EP54_14230 [Staphylococcus aureus]
MSIRLNKKLNENAFNDPTKETIQKSINQLCSDVDSGQVIMPIFQRDLSWTAEKKIDLYNFQLGGFAPVSPISMNRIGPKSKGMPHVKLLSRTEIEELNEGSLSVIDGQQRISTNYQAYSNDESIQEIALDLTKGKFVNLKEKKPSKNQIPVGVLYNKDPEVYTEYLRFNPKLAEFSVSSILGQIRTKFFNYFYTINYAQDLSGEEQIEWFDVLNLAGSRVPELQMKLTKLQIKGLDFYKEYSNIFRDRLEMAGLDHLFIQKNTEVSIPLATLNSAFEIVSGKKNHTSNYSPIPSDAKGSFLNELEPDQLRKCFKMTLNGLEDALNFIDINSLREPSRIDYISYLSGYFTYNKNASNTSIQNVINWYNNTNFGNKSNQERRELYNELLMC